MIYNIVLVLGVQKIESVIHTQISIVFRFFSDLFKFAIMLLYKLGHAKHLEECIAPEKC